MTEKSADLVVTGHHYVGVMEGEEQVPRPSQDVVLEQERLYRSWLRGGDADPLAYVEVVDGTRSTPLSMDELMVEGRSAREAFRDGSFWRAFFKANGLSHNGD
jgi:hypothetical protein